MSENIKYAKQIVVDIQRRNEECKEDTKGYVNGDAFEKWLKQQLRVNYDKEMRYK